MLAAPSAFAECGQADTPASLSQTAQAIVALNQALFGRGVASANIAGIQARLARLSGGPRVLQQRAVLVRELIQTHPEEVRSVMLDRATAAALIAADPVNADFLEHEATLTGDLSTLIAEDFATETSRQVYTLHDASTAERFELHPTAALSLHSLLHRPVAVTGVQLGADIAADSAALPGPDGVRLVSAATLRVHAGTVPPGNTTLTCSTTGEQKTAVLILQFPNNTPAYPAAYGTAAWWKQAIAGGGKSVNSLWAEMTAGTTYATVDVYGPLTLSQSYGCNDYLALRSAALALAAQTVDLSQYTRIVLGFPESTCNFGGLADVGCNGADSLVPHPYSVAWMPIVTTYTASTSVWGSLAHELGHNLGLNHANTLDFSSLSLGPIDFQATNPGTVGNTGATTALGAVTAVDKEYGDVFSVMGSPWTAGPGPYSAQHRADLLGWVPASGSANGLVTVQNSGSYTIQPASSGTSLRAMRVLRDSSSASWLWLEYRDGGTAFDAANLNGVSGQNMSRGAVVHYENGYGDRDKTYALDMTPTAKGNNFADGALLPGTAWSDPYSPLSLTVNGIAAAGLSVSVRYDSTCASFAATTDPVAASGGSGTVTVTAAVKCAWSASTNATWLTLGGTTSGTGSGSFTWTAAANTGAGQRVTYLTVGRVSRRLLQLGSGANVVAISPANATVTPGGSSVLSLTLQDSSGLADLRNVVLNATAAGTPPCYVYAAFHAGAPIFYLLDPNSNTFTSGVVAGGSGSAVTSSCTLSGVHSGITVSGSTMTLALNLTFPAAIPGVRALYGTVNGGTELPLGILNVGTIPATQINPPTAAQATAITLAATPVSALPGTTVTMTAAVTSSSGVGVPTGSITLLDGASTLATVALDAAGKASFAASTLSNGAHALVAMYGGDGNFAASTSAVATVTIAQASTTATLTGSATAVEAGGNTTLTVTIGHTAGAADASGTVTLRDGSTALTSATLSHGTASFPLRGLSAGTHTYIAVYGGDATYLGSTSNTLSVVAGKPSATLKLDTAPMVFAGQAVSVTATVSRASTTGTAVVVPTGVITLQDGGRALGTASLVNGVASFSLGALPAGAHALTATYAGDSTLDASSAATATVDVIDFSLVPMGTPAITIKAGATSGNTAQITVTPGSAGFPAGIAFACTGAPANATCTVTPGLVTPGSNAVPVTVTVTTAAPTSTTTAKAGFAGWFGLPLLGLLAHRRGRHSGLRLLAALIVSGAALAGVTGCGSGVSGPAGSTTTTVPTGGTPTGASVLTVQAIATRNGATLAHSASFTLQVQ